jgi:hypothetical protein
LRRNPGTGVHRTYPERAIVDAAILSLLSKFFGASAPMVLFTGALDLAVDQLPKAKYAAEKDPPEDIFLLIAVMKGQEGEPLHAPWQVKAEIQYVEMDDRSRPKDAAPPNRILKIPPLMSGGLFVNLTDLFERVRVPLDEYEREDEFYETFRPKGPRIKRG